MSSNNPDVVIVGLSVRANLHNTKKWTQITDTLWVCMNVDVLLELQ